MGMRAGLAAARAHTAKGKMHLVSSWALIHGNETTERKPLV
jgi:hypothetical protein